MVSTARADGSVLSSVVNAGVVAHPTTGTDVVAFVSGARAGRLAHIRGGAPVTLVARRGRRWIGVTGPAQLIGPDDERGLGREGIRLLLRAIFTAAGGTHDDWAAYDAAMADERRVAVLVTPDRLLGND